MAFNGSGTFVRAYNWATDAANSIMIDATRMDGEDNGFAGKELFAEVSHRLGGGTGQAGEAQHHRQPRAPAASTEPRGQRTRGNCGWH